MDLDSLLLTPEEIRFAKDGTDFNDRLGTGKAIAQAQLDKIKRSDWVQLAEDQSLPPLIDKFQGQVKRVLYQAKFRRVIISD